MNKCSKYTHSIFYALIILLRATCDLNINIYIMGQFEYAVTFSLNKCVLGKLVENICRPYEIPLVLDQRSSVLK